MNEANERELKDDLQRLRAERERLLVELPSLRDEVEARIQARETLIEELDILRKESARLMGDLEKAAAGLSSLEAELEKAGATRQATQAKSATNQPTLLAGRGQDTGLPLLFAHSLPEISPDWDSYQLESEFHTDEQLDAKRVAELVKELPGVAGCLIVKKHGPVLAGQLAERLPRLYPGVQEKLATVAAELAKIYP